MINSRLLVSGTEYFSNYFAINPYYKNEIIDTDKAKKEHDEIITYFERAGIQIIKIPAPRNCQDGVYTANWALVKDGVAVMARLPEARHAEEPYAKRELENLGIKCVEVPDGYLFSGQGDSLRAGDYLFAGSGYRSDPEAQVFAAKTLGLNLIQLHAKPELNPDGSEHINPITNRPDSFFYDIDLAISVIDEKTIAYCPDALDDASNAKLENLTGFDKIIVDFDECIKGFACNLVSTGKIVVMSNQAPKLKSELEARGLVCLTPDVTELKKGGGYIRCISLWLS